MRRFNLLRQKSVQYLGYIRRSVHIVWEAAGWHVVGWMISLVLSGALPPLTIILTRTLVNEVIVMIQRDSFDLASLAWPALPLVTVFVMQTLINNFSQWNQLIQNSLVQDHISRLIQQKALSLDLLHFEVPDYYNKLHLARTDARSRPLRFVQTCGSLVQQAVNLTGTVIVLASLFSWLLPLLFIAALPVFAVVVRHNRAYLEWMREIGPKQRKSTYYDLLLTEREAAAEVRTLNIGLFYHQRFTELREQIREEVLSLQQKRMVNTLAAWIASTLITGLGIIWTGWRVLQGQALIGDLVAFYQALQQGKSIMQSFQSSAGQLVDDTLSLRNLFDFLDLQSSLQDNAGQPMLSLPLKKGIYFESITFCYPGSEHPALKNFTWTLPAGRIVALVGANGTGKSTLTKLMCRLYDPTEGHVFWDGTEVSRLPLQQVWGSVSILFQRPYHYYDTAARVIAMGDPQLDLDMEMVEKAARLSSADEVVDELSMGYETLLDKRFGGTELSIGQWQRLALARTLYHDRSILILDEPTSAIDTWIENQWLTHLREIAPGKTILLITHRLTTASLADHIAVLHNHAIVEEGTHDELLGQSGLYATAWREYKGNMNRRAEVS